MRARKRDRKTENQAQARRAAVAQALADAQGRDGSSHESQATGHESPLSPPCCANCGYATRLQDGSRELLVCTNCPALPGQMRVTKETECCRLFQKRGPRVLRTAPPEPQDSSIRHIPLTQGKYTIIDAADYERVAAFNWCVSASGNRVYAQSYMNGKTMVLHRFLTNAPAGMVVDHIDHNGLNNRRSNLRICTSQQNLYNSRPHGKTSRFKGVSWNTRLKRWIASIHHAGRTHFIGQFTDEIEAAKAYDRAAAAMFGEYAYLNFPAGTQSTGGGSRSDAATHRGDDGPRRAAPAGGSYANRPASEQSSEREDRCSLTCPFTHTGPPQEQRVL